jgi:hypothetical protein
MSKKTKQPTVADLTAQYNELTGKSVKPGSYSRAKLLELIEAAQPVEKKAKQPKFGEDTVSLADIAREHGLNVKVVRARFRRLRAKGAELPDVLDEARWVFKLEDKDTVAALVTKQAEPQVETNTEAEQVEAS